LGAEVNVAKSIIGAKTTLMLKLFIIGSLENKFFIAKSSLTRLASQKPEKKSIAPAKKRGWSMVGR
jgi:hypothetical protein